MGLHCAFCGNARLPRRSLGEGWSLAFSEQSGQRRPLPQMRRCAGPNGALYGGGPVSRASGIAA